MRRSLPILFLFISLALNQAAWAAQRNPTICCRTSGGTRSTCLNLWAHLVPPGNRFAPGPSRRIALLQGPANAATAMTVQISQLSGELLAEQTLPAGQVGIWLLTLPRSGQVPLAQPLVWESFPTCQPNKPPTRTILHTGPEEREAAAIYSRLAALHHSCGGEVATASILPVFGLEDYRSRLPQTLPIHCLAFTEGAPGSPQLPGNGSSP